MSISTRRPVRPRSRISARELDPLLLDWRPAGTGQPGYRALADRLRLLILDGRLPAGTVLPSERTLAQSIGASRTTTTAAYRQLRDDGYADGSQGAGTWTKLPRDTGPVTAWPVSHDGESGHADGSGDLASAAAAAPPEVHAAYVAALSDLPRYLPGNGYVTAGLQVLREQIASTYTARGLPTAPEEILVTAGALHALHLTLALLVQRGDRVLVEHPTYPVTIDAVRRAGGRPVALPVEDGWQPDRICRTLRQSGARLACLIPDFHNPTGQLMDGQTRTALSSALSDTGAVAVIDETTQSLDLRSELGRPAPSVAPFAAYARPGSVVTLGSASKMIWGGLRIGWIRAERSLIAQLMVARARDDVAGPVVEQLATAHLLDHLPVLIPRRRAQLAAQYVALRDALAAELPQWRVPEPAGGMVLWAHLPQPRSSELVAGAAASGLILTAGPRFGVDGSFESRLRIPFTRPPEELRAAAGLLATAWHSPIRYPGVLDRSDVI
jgi:DNA-binding transcriptional MocR family regulator